MKCAAKFGVGLGLLLMVSGCGGFEAFEGTQAYQGPTSVIATGQDQGRDENVLQDGEAAIAYDPDGCQVWIIDDGVEGYASPRFNPKTGLPVCDNKHPPGTVIGPYQTESAPISDGVSGPGRKAVVR
ncbi:MAG: hypothetical protein HC844_08905 [Tabrizicola sp.]|nr:hypothetical protein [Tabrizicola sp.]